MDTFGYSVEEANEIKQGSNGQEETKSTEMFNNPNSALSKAATVAATVVAIRTIVNDLIPPFLSDYLYTNVGGLLHRCFSSRQTAVIEEFDGFSINEIFMAAEVYLGTKTTSMSRRIRVSKKEKDEAIEVGMELGDEITDTFQGVCFTWRLCSRVSKDMTIYHNYQLGVDSTFGAVPPPSSQKETRRFELTFHRKHKAMVIDDYLPYILEKAKGIKMEEKTLKIYTRQNDMWVPSNLDHPATFDTMALDPDLRMVILKDLESFLGRKEYYRRVGKAWKRGYLLYGPPGTGKSSLIAAIANLLKFDLYDIELTGVQSNFHLRNAMLSTGNRSILVIEDIDRCISQLRPLDDPYNPSNQVTLSGLLNFIDGLWSSMGDERIVIFTTNNKDDIDPALLRPGRMDMHIHMTYCSPCVFRALVSNYHGEDDRPMLKEIEELINEVTVTPAEMAGELMKSDDLDTALGGVVRFIEEKRVEIANGITTLREDEIRTEVLP